MKCFYRSIAIVLAVAFLGAMPGAVPVRAQDAPGTATGKGLVFVELFSAERCPFCPQAERNMHDILSDPEILGFTCMVDYFDTGTPGGMSQSFCTAQQDLYIRMLKSGSRYTPQMVINGRVQLPGYNVQKTAAAILAQRAESFRVQPMMIQPGTAEGVYDVVLPSLRTDSAALEEPYVLRLIMIRKTPRIAQGEGNRQARERMPAYVASGIIDSGFWDGNRRVWSVTPPQDMPGDAFVVVAQDRRSGAILAAGKADLSPQDVKNSIDEGL